MSGCGVRSIDAATLRVRLTMSQRIRGLLILAGYAILSIMLFTTLNGPALMYGVLGLTILFIILFALSLRRSAVAAPVRRGPQPSHDAVAGKIEEIEQELKRMGAWQQEPLPPEAWQFRSAFAMDTMAFEQWLQFILIPRVREIVETRGEFPPESHLAPHAVREFDGRDDTDRLCTLLHEFDRLFGPVRYYGT